MEKIKKARTGISGLDEITSGGLPAGRITLICGGPGCGKSLFSAEFLVNGATQFKEPGVFIAFEESTKELSENFASLGFDMEKLQSKKLIKMDYVHIDQKEIEETGDYDLEGLFIRIAHAIKSVGAKRLVLDTIENLFFGLSNHGILRSELRRLFKWLKEQDVTTIITGERGNGTLTRHGLEEYVSDCVILLDHRVTEQVSTRRLRIVKYRGSEHGTNEYPFLIEDDGLIVMPITSLLLDKEASTNRVSTGLPVLDKMFGGKGIYRGGSILVSGRSGSGKTSMACTFANAACERGERCLFFTFEESPKQLSRNMRSIGMDLERHINKGILRIHAARPTLHGLEMHLVTIYKYVKEFKPKVVVIDPISNLTMTGNIPEIKSMVIRLIDFLQNEKITVLFTSLTSNQPGQLAEDDYIASLVDSWVIIRDEEMDDLRSFNLRIFKSSGLKSTNRVVKFELTNNGIQLTDLVKK